MSGSVRQFGKSRAEIPDAASPKRLHQNPQHQPQQPPRKRESPGQAASPLSATNKHRGANRCRTKRSQAIECHRKDTPQRTLSQQRHKSLEAKAGNRQSPTTAMPQQQCRNKNRSPRHPTKWKPQPPQRAESRIRHRNTKPLPRPYPRAPHSDSLQQPINHL